MRLAFVLALLTASPARAEDDTARARIHFEIGNGMYRLGDYRGALREFATGYELTNKPGFLINLGQTYRKLNQPARAREMYLKYLASTPPDDPARAQVQQLLADMPRELEPSPAPVIAPVEIVKPPPPPPRRHRGLQISGIVLGVVGLGLVGGGGGATAVAEDTANQINRLQTFDAAKDDQYRLNRTLEYSLFGAGAAVLAVGIVLIAVGSR